jgi:phosphomannomutase
MIMGDQLMVLLARDVLQKQPNATIIADVKSSQVLFDEIAKAGGTPLMWKTGHSLIKYKMAEIGAALAGEVSGHIFYKDNNCFDDGLYAAIRLINILANSAESLANILDSIPKTFSTHENRIDVPEERKFKVIEEIKALVIKESANLNDIDGLRVNTSDGWWLLRASNTQAALIARCEASTQAGLHRLEAILAGYLGGCGV